jgi:hypothetical protein
MPSPFPGMDPYIEAPELWPNMHLSLIAEIRNALNIVLPPNYVADIGERVFLEHFPGSMGPDVAVVKFPKTPKPKFSHDGGVAVAVDVCDEPMRLLTFVEETRQPFVQIIRTGNESTIVVEIEVLSPTNKASGRGRRNYLQKQERLLFGGAHFIEIDLLRAGKHTIACPRPSKDQHIPWDYLVSLHRAASFNEFEVWARTVRQSLPRISVPLLNSDSDVVLDLQRVFSKCYDQGRFNIKLDYSIPPKPPLNPEDAAWAQELLNQKRAAR